MKRASVEQLSNVIFDLIIIGGGITGAAIARDAALRGLRAVLVEKEDFASGTSSRSSKLIHGGLRYLETYQFGLVTESVRERELALQLAPHLTKVQPFLYMLYDDMPEKKWQLNLGLSFYDFVSGNRRQRRHKMLTKDQVLSRQPQFQAQGLNGAAMFYDVSTDDARITIDTIKSAAEHGAQVINHCEVIGLTYSDNQCNGITVKDKLTATQHEIKGHYVINSTGPWSDDILRFDDPKSHVLQPTKGVHIVLRKQDFPIHSGVFMRSPDDGRVVWPIPSTQDDRVFIGTTDTTYEGDINHVYPEKTDIRYLLNVANHLMPNANLTENHVIGSWAGLRPLIKPKPSLSNSNSKVPREHQILKSESGVFSIIGGKLTSHRVMAKQVLDTVITSDEYKYLSPQLNQYIAHQTPISGARTSVSGQDEYNKNNVISMLENKGIPLDLAIIWTSRYGYNALKVSSYWLDEQDNQVTLSKRGLTLAEIHYCVKEESASSIKDLLIRRTSEFFWNEDGGLENIEKIAEELQHLLGWDQQEKSKQIDDYYELVHKHRPSSANVID